MVKEGKYIGKANWYSSSSSSSSSTSVTLAQVKTRGENKDFEGKLGEGKIGTFGKDKDFERDARGEYLWPFFGVRGSFLYLWENF